MADQQRLLEFVQQMANFTTPEDEVAGTTREPWEFVSDLPDTRLCDEYETFMVMVREARGILING